MFDIIDGADYVKGITFDRINGYRFNVRFYISGIRVYRVCELPAIITLSTIWRNTKRNTMLANCGISL